MIGVAVIVVVLVVVIPVAVLMSAAVASAILGYLLTEDAASRYEGSEELALGG